MPIREVQGSLCLVKLELSPAEIPNLRQIHAEKYPGACRLEADGQALIETQFDPRLSKEFVREVCEWGRGQRFMDRIESSPEVIAKALSEGVDLVQKGWVAEGVERVRQLSYLGQSFASKQLRFLVPSRVVILDSVIRGRLGYTENVSGYSEFLADCCTVLESVRKSTQLDEAYVAALRVCDIEAAIFAKVQG